MLRAQWQVEAPGEEGVACVEATSPLDRGLEASRARLDNMGGGLWPAAWWPSSQKVMTDGEGASGRAQCKR